MTKLRAALAAILATLALAACSPGAGGPGLQSRPDPHPGVDVCTDTDKPGYQRACFEISTYCDGHATPFDFTISIVAVGLDLQKRKFRDPTTGEEFEINMNFPDSTRIPEDDPTTARLVIAVDYPMVIPPSLLAFAALSGATATRGCDAFLAISSPQTKLHPHGTGLFGSGASDMDYFLAEEDFVPMTLTSTVEIPYLLPPA